MIANAFLQASRKTRRRANPPIHTRSSSLRSEIKQKTPVPVDSSAAPLRDAIAPEQKKPSTKERAAGKSGSESGLRQPKQKAQKGPPEGQQGPGLGTKQSAGSDLEQPAQSRSGPRWEAGRAAGAERAEDWAAGQPEGPAGYSIQA